jgi:hypothetical protein
MKIGKDVEKLIPGNILMLPSTLLKSSDIQDGDGIERVS